MEKTKRTKCLIDFNDAIKAKLTAADSYGNAKLVRFELKYHNQRQIDAINKEYGGKKEYDGTSAAGVHVYDGVTYVAYANSRTNPKIDTLDVFGNFDIDVPLKRLVEHNGMRVIVDDLVIFNRYDEYNQSIRQAVMNKINRFAKERTAEIMLGGVDAAQNGKLNLDSLFDDKQM